MIENISGGRVKIGADSNIYTIEALISIRDYLEHLPKNNIDFNEQDYNHLRLSDDYVFKGFAGFAFSYAGKWLGGWRRDKEGKRDYVAEAFKNAQKQSEKIKDCLFIQSHYSSLRVPPDSLIYCDPPYQGTTGYGIKFNHSDFFEWCRSKASQGHKIFVSEYEAPSDFDTVWTKEINSSLTKNTGSKAGLEKLFKLNI